MSLTRYAIRWPDGSYSQAPRCGSVYGVPLDKAKLWRTKGHVTAHLHTMEYDPGTVVVEVTITPGAIVLDVGEWQDKARKRRDAEAKARGVADAKERVARAERELAAARKAAGL